MTVRLMSTSRLAGRVFSSDGRPVTSGGVDLVRASRYEAGRRGVNIRADGTFEFSAVSPGRYQLIMWRAASLAVSTEPCEFAAAGLEVTGGEPPEVVLVLRPCLRIAGRVEVAADATPAAPRASLTGAPVRFEADRSSGAPMYTLLPVLTTIGADGTFSVGGSLQLVPGPYLVHADVPSQAPGTGWWLQSARTADGRDILDVPLTLTDGSPETTNVVLTFTDRHTSLSGSLVTAGGRPAIDYTVLAFTTNRDWWRPPFRRVLAARPATDGAFLLHDLPPGEILARGARRCRAERVARPGVPRTGSQPGSARNDPSRRADGAVASDARRRRPPAIGNITEPPDPEVSHRKSLVLPDHGRLGFGAISVSAKPCRRERTVRAPPPKRLLRAWRDGRQDEPCADGGNGFSHRLRGGRWTGNTSDFR